MANHTIKVWLKMMKEQNIPQDSLIAGYLPADYCDSFSRNVVSEKAITSDEFFDMAFNHSPAWVNAQEIVFGMPDKHLTFHAALWCGEKESGGQTFTITTVVKFNNRLGRLYFFFIRPFHKVIIRSMLKRVAKRLK